MENKNKFLVFFAIAFFAGMFFAKAGLAMAVDCSYEEGLAADICSSDPETGVPPNEDRCNQAMALVNECYNNDPITTMPIEQTPVGSSDPCKDAFGQYAVSDSGGWCGCVSGYDWNEGGDACVLPTDPNAAMFTDYDGCVRYYGSGDQCAGLEGAPAASTCDPSPSCWWYNCCSKDNTNTYAYCMDPNGGGGNSVSCKDMPNAPSTTIVGGQTKCASGVCVTAPGVAVTTQPLTFGGQLYPTGSIINTNAGTITAPNETVGTLPATSGGSFMMCANGILAPACTGGEGTPVVIGGGTYNPGTGGNAGGLPYTPDGNVGGLAGAKCGTGFSEIGGVCFPTTTGLSAAPMTVILSNIFSWLMGLFTTFAVAAFVVSGIQYLVSSGSQDVMEAAKRNATYALIGIVVGLSGFVIVRAIATALSGQGYFF